LKEDFDGAGIAGALNMEEVFLRMSMQSNKSSTFVLDSNHSLCISSVCGSAQNSAGCFLEEKFYIYELKKLGGQCF
jgi:hypothetical protein